MSINIPSREDFKEKAKVIRSFLKEKCGVDVSHGHCIELISKLFGFNDWNTASATLKPKMDQNSLPIKIETVGDMRRALDPFKDSDSIDGVYEFKIEEFLSKLDSFDDPQDTITQQFSFTLEDLGEKNDEFRTASFKLELDYEDIMHDETSSGGGFFSRSLN